MNAADPSPAHAQLTTERSRRALQLRLFEAGIPQLWCPTLTHFSAAAVPDEHRMRCHLSTLAPHVGGALVPGSTGEGWEMNDADIRAVCRIVLDAASAHGVKVLIGILKTEVDDVLTAIDQLKELLTHPAAVGLTVCPPGGAEKTQDELECALTAVLSLGHPTGLYQLPQVTQNEMSAELVARLAQRYPNFIFFKDTSGHDRVAFSGVDLHGLFLVRGSEQGGYDKWTKAAGGRYDGFLLSTANVFARELSTMLVLQNEGELAAAANLSARLQAVVSEAFAMVAEVPYGNAFANVNKLIDHCFAYGSAAVEHPGPILYSGARLSSEWVSKTRELLQRHGFELGAGYLNACGEASGQG